MIRYNSSKDELEKFLSKVLKWDKVTEVISSMIKISNTLLANFALQAAARRQRGVQNKSGSDMI
jgi:hypothetical protein